MDRRRFTTLAALALAGLAPAAQAALPNGTRAPDFTLEAALGG